MSGEYHSKLFVPLTVKSSTNSRIRNECHTPIMQIDSFPIRIIPRIKAPTFGVELVTKDKVPLGAIFDRSVRIRLGGRVAVDEAKVSRQFRYLSSRVDPAEVIPSQRARFLLAKVHRERISSTTCQLTVSASNLGTSAGTYKRPIKPSARTTRQPRFMIPRAVRIDPPESWCLSRRGSGLWRSSSGSG
jgi:hypothetical protein